MDKIVDSKFRARLAANAERRNFLSRQKMSDPIIKEHKIAPLMAARTPDVIDGAHIGLIKAAIRAPFSNDPIVSEAAIASFQNTKVKDFNDAFLYGNNLNRYIRHQYTGNGIGQNVSEARDALFNIINKDGRFVGFDLETLGARTDGFGRNIGPIITEFSFSEMVGEIGSGNNPSVSKEYGSIIGIEEKEYKELKNLIQKYTSNQKVTEDEMVTLERLALMGNDKTTIDWNKWENDGRGIFRYSSFAEKHEIGFTKKEMLKGLEDLRKIGKIQEATKSISGMYGWEQELYSALENVVKNDLTAVAHNGRGFDDKSLNLLLNSNNVSNEMKSRTERLFEGRGLSFKHELDPLALMRGQAGDRQELLYNLVGKDDKKLAELNNFMRKNGKSQLTQEVFMEALRLSRGGTRIQDAAHVAASDVFGVGTMIMQSIFDPRNPSSLATINPGVTSRIFSASSDEVFYAASSINANESGLFTLVRDPMTGQYRTSDGISIGNNGTTIESFPQTGIKRRAMYVPTGIGEIKRGSSAYDAIVGAHRDLDNGSLMYVRLNPLSESEAIGANSETILVGPEAEIKKKLDQTFVHVGKMNDDGEFELKNLTEKEKSLFQRITVHEDGKVAITDPTAKDLMAESTFAFDNDAPARSARDHSITKDIRALRYIKDMDAYAEQQIAEHYTHDSRGKLKSKSDGTVHDTKTVRELFRRQFRDSLYKRTESLAKDRHLGSGAKITAEKAKGTFFEYVGWKPLGGEYTAYSNSVSNLIGLENYVRSNQEMIEQAIEFAEKKSGKDRGKYDPLLEAYYHTARNALETEALSIKNPNPKSSSSINKVPVGFNNRGRLGIEMQNIFEVDVNGFRTKNKPGGNIVQFNLGASGMSIAKSVYRAMGYAPETIDDIKPETKVNMLGSFQSFLERALGVPPERLRITSKDSVDSAGTKIISMMQNERSKYPTAGWLSPTSQHDVTHGLSNHGMSSERVSKVLSELSSSLEIVKNPLGVSVNKAGQVTYDKAKVGTLFDDIATRINDNILFDGITQDHDKFVEQMKKSGYSARDAETLFQSQKVKRAESKALVLDVVSKIYANGGMVGYSEKNKKVFMFETSSKYKSGEMRELYLPRQTLEDGAFYTRIGERQTRHIDPLVLTPFGQDGDQRFRLTSTIGKARSQFGYYGKIIYDKAQEGNLGEGIDLYLKKINSLFQSKATILTGDQQDKVMANVFDLNDITKMMGAISRSESLQQVAKGAGIAQQVLADMAANSGKYTEKAFSDLAYHEAAAVRQYVETFGKIVSHSLAGEQKELFNRILPAISRGINHADKGYVQGLLDTGNALEGLHANQTGIESKLKRSALFDTTTGEFEALEAQGMRSGAALRSTFEEARVTGASAALNRTLEDTLVGSKLSATTEDWREIVREGTKRGHFKGYTAKILSSAITDEGAALVTSYVADAALNHRFYEQHVRVSDVGLASDPRGRARGYERMLDGPMGDAMAYMGFEKDANGKITGVKYESNNGAFVRKGEALFDKFSSFGGGTELVTAKQTGFLRTGVFRGGVKLTDSEVADFLGSEEHLKRINSAENPYVEAYKILQGEKELRHDFYVDELSIAGNSKFSDMSEKNQGRVIIAGLGKKDKAVAKALTEFKATELIGMEVTPDFVRELMEYDKTQKAITKTKMGITINAMREAKKLTRLSDNEMLETIQKMGFNDVSEFGQALYSERHSATDEMHSGLRAMGILGRDEHIAAVTNNFAGQRKHLDPTIVKSLILQMEKSGSSPQQIADELKDVLPGIEVRDGKLIYDGGSQINYGELKKITDRYGLIHKLKGRDGNDILNSNGEAVQYEIARTEIRQLQNLDEARVSDDGTHIVRADERVFNNLIAHRYDQAYLDAAEKKLKGVMGEELGDSLYDSLIRDRKTGEILNESLAEKIKKGIFATSGEGRIYDPFNSDFTTTEYRESIQKLRDRGLSTNQIDSIVRSMIDNGAEKITWDKVSEFNSAISFGMAHSFNANLQTGKKHTLEEMKRAGFSVVGIDDLSKDAIAALKTGDEAGFEKFSDMMSGKSFVIDMYSKDLELKGAPQIYTDPNNRYLAIPFQEIGRENPDGSSTPSRVNSKVASLVRRFDNYINTYTQLSESPDAQVQNRIRATESMEDIRSEISAELTDKKGRAKKAATARIADGVGHLTAQGHTFLGNKLARDAAGNIVDTGESLDGAFEKFKLFGKSISEFATRNRLIDAGAISGDKFELGYSILGKEVQKAWYNKDLFSTIAGGDSEVAKLLEENVGKYLESGGATFTGVMRQPAQRNRSTGAMATYFSDAVGNDQITMSIREMLQKKGDFDSDKLAAMMLKSKATIEFEGGKVVNTDRLDYATYQVLQQMEGVNVKLHDNTFKDAQSEIIAAALDYNVKVEPRNPALKGGSLDVEHLLEKSTWDGEHSIDFRRSYSHDEIQRERANWEVLKKEFAPLAGEMKEDSREYLSAMSKYADTLGDEAAATKETMHFHAWDKAYTSIRNAEISKQAAGILNDVEYTWQQMTSHAKHLTPQQSGLIMSGIAAAQEATLTGKSETGETDILRVQKMKEIRDEAYRAMRSNIGREEAAEKTTAFYRQLFADRAQKEFAMQPGWNWGRGSQDEWWLSIGGEKIEEDIIAKNAGKSADEINNIIIAEQAAQLQGHVVRTTNLKGVSIKALKLGVSASGFGPDTELTMLSGTSEESLMAKSDEIMNQAAREMGLDTEIIRETAAPAESKAAEIARESSAARSATRSMASSVPGVSSAVVAPMLGVGAKKALGGISKIGGFGAIGVGIAAGILTSGYVSGPTVKTQPHPAQNHAEDAHTDEKAMQKPTLSDSNVVAVAQPQASYVININASSQKDRNDAIEGIKNAAAGITPRNGNVNISINTRQDSLSQVSISRMVSNAFLGM